MHTACRICPTNETDRSDKPYSLQGHPFIIVVCIFLMERSNKSPRNILCACAIFRALLVRARSTRFFQNDEKGDRPRKIDVSAGPWLHRIGKAGSELRRARYKVDRLKSTRSRFFFLSRKDHGSRVWRTQSSPAASARTAPLSSPIRPTGRAFINLRFGAP